MGNPQAVGHSAVPKSFFGEALVPETSRFGLTKRPISSASPTRGGCCSVYQEARKAPNRVWVIGAEL